jgi:chromosome segregation ATPase
LHPQRRRFVRDGEVAVTVVNRGHVADDPGGTNMLESARQALRSAVTARERAERQVEEAQVAIRDLQTKLAHERLARDEAQDLARRHEAETQTIRQSLQTVEAELAEERRARRTAEHATADAHEARRDAERRLREAEAMKRSAPAEPIIAGIADSAAPRRKTRQTVEPAKRRQPAQLSEDDAQPVVEWWVKGWQKKYRA